MSLHERYALGLLAAMLAAGCILPSLAQSEGVVRDESGPVAGARVGRQGLCERVTTDASGLFRLRPSAAGRRLVANKEGYRIVATDHIGSLMLRGLPTHDHLDYAWIDPHPDPARTNNCANCHDEIYREWQRSAHARSATNPKFLSIFASVADVAPAQNRDQSAVCATCHAPTLRSPTLEYDIRQAEDIAKSGIHCDYCHKVADVPIDKLGIRFGRDGMRLLRPSNDDLISYGPLDDAVRQGESFCCLPVYKESRYCASCHEGVVFGVHAYGTYSEWLESPARLRGQQCQDCHMTPSGKMTNMAPGKGGIERDPKTLASHDLPGSAELMRKAVALTAQAKRTQHGLQVEVEVMAQHVGHRVPTGFPDRQLVLIVQAVDSDGRAAPLLDGKRLPASAGKWSGVPGALYAKHLSGEAGPAPAPFWSHITKTVDTRLIPEEPNRHSFIFADSARRINVKIYYRRFWQEIADEHGWQDNDSLIAQRELTAP